MKNVFESASKIVFVLLTLALIGLTAMRIIEAKDFIMLCGMAFTFYFSAKGDKSQPYAGK